MSIPFYVMATLDLPGLRRFMEAAAREGGYRSLNDLATAKSGRVATLSDWWSGRSLPDLATLDVWAGYLDRAPRDLMAALYGARWRVVLDDEMEALVIRAAQEAVRQLRAEGSHDE